MLWHFKAGFISPATTANRRILWAAPASGVVTKAGAAAGPELPDEAGGLLAAGREGGAAQAILRLIHQLVGGGALQHRRKGLVVSGWCGSTF